MAIISTVKKISTDSIACGGTLTVTLGLTATPDIRSDPADIVLALDVSGSMGTSGALEHMKTGACALIDMICAASDGEANRKLGGASRIGIVSFSSTAAADVCLTQNVAELKDTIRSFAAMGSTNHAAAFTKSQEMFDPASSNRKIILMFTDGETSAGPDPAPAAQAAKAAGITIFCIGLGLPRHILAQWASDPDSTHVSWSDNVVDVEPMFLDLGLYMVGAGVIHGVIDEVIHSDFRIVQIHTPSIGSAAMTGENSLLWKIDALGAAEEESATLDFEIQHNEASGGGQKAINQSITLTDDTGASAVFPSPVVSVGCDDIVIPEPCPQPVSFTLNGCQDSAVIDLNDVDLLSLGRIVQLNVTIKNVCPNKRVALAVQLTEVDCRGNEHNRGIKTVTIPAHSGRRCCDIQVHCLRFVLPEDLSAACTCRGMCDSRTFKARVMANYLDTDFVCCDDPQP